MASRRRQEGGKKPAAEGRHGDVTHEAIQEQLKHKLTTEPVGADKPAAAPGPDGKHRIIEHRQQHDEADRDSEKNRLARQTKHTSGENK